MCLSGAHDGILSALLGAQGGRYQEVLTELLESSYIFKQLSEHKNKNFRCPIFNIKNSHAFL